MAVAVLAPSRDTTFRRPPSGCAHFGGQRLSLIRNNGWNGAVVAQRARAGSDSGSQSSSPNITPRLATQQQNICQSQGGLGAVTDAGLQAALMAAKAQGKTALCIWFHYLAGKGADWEHGLKSKIASQLPWVEWYFPDAQKRPVTNYNGAMERCWFDQLEGQVTENMATPGLDASASMVHALLRQAEAHGIPSNRILLGGMSQGGVLAMMAGFTYEKPLAGIIAMSAWVPPCLPGAVKQSRTPLMMGNGDRDDVVPMNVFQKSIRKLEQTGCNRITKKVYPGLDHTWKDCECQDVKQFILSTMPSTQVHNGRRWSC